MHMQGEEGTMEDPDAAGVTTLVRVGLRSSKGVFWCSVSTTVHERLCKAAGYFESAVAFLEECGVQPCSSEVDDGQSLQLSIVTNDENVESFSLTMAVEVVTENVDLEKSEIPEDVDLKSPPRKKITMSDVNSGLSNQMGNCSPFQEKNQEEKKTSTSKISTYIKSPAVQTVKEDGHHQQTAGKILKVLESPHVTPSLSTSRGTCDQDKPKNETTLHATNTVTTQDDHVLPKSKRKLFDFGKEASTMPKQILSNSVTVFHVPENFEKPLLLMEINRQMWISKYEDISVEAAVKCDDPSWDGSVIVEFTSAEKATKACQLPIVEYLGSPIELNQNYEEEKLNLELVQKTTLTNFVSVFDVPENFDKSLLLMEINRRMWFAKTEDIPVKAAVHCDDPSLDGSVLVEFTNIEKATKACQLPIVEYLGSPIRLIQTEKKEKLEIDVPAKKISTNLVMVFNVPVNFVKPLLLMEINRRMWIAKDENYPLEAAVKCQDRALDGSVIVEFSSVNHAAKACRFTDLSYLDCELVLLHIEEEVPNLKNCKSKVTIKHSEFSYPLDNVATTTENDNVVMYHNFEDSDQTLTHDNEASKRGKWSRDETRALVNCLLEGHKNKSIQEWTDSDWGIYCLPVINKYSVTVDLCKWRKKSLSDYHQSCVRLNRTSWEYFQDFQILKSRSPSAQKCSKLLSSASVKIATETNAPQVPLYTDSEDYGDEECDEDVLLPSKAIPGALKINFRKGKAWSEPENFALIYSWAEHKDSKKFNIPNREIWKRIHDTLEAKGFSGRTVKQCVGRMASLLDAFKKIVDAGKQSGNGAASMWPYFDALYLILEKNVTVKPKFLVACGSSNTTKKPSPKPNEFQQPSSALGVTSRPNVLHRKSRTEVRDELLEKKVNAQVDFSSALRDLTQALKDRRAST